MKGRASADASRRPSVLLPLPAGPSTVTTRSPGAIPGPAARVASAMPLREAHCRAKAPHLVVAQWTRCPLSEPSQGDRPDGETEQIGDVKTDRRHHATDHAFAALGHHDV